MNQRYHSLGNLALLLGSVAAATWWGLQLVPAGAPREPVAALPAGPMPAAPVPLDAPAVAGLFGPVLAAEAAPVRLIGVIATGSNGVALLAVGAQPAMAWRVGEEVDGHGTLQAVEAGRVLLKRGATTIEVALPALLPPEGIVPSP